MIMMTNVVQNQKIIGKNLSAQSQSVNTALFSGLDTNWKDLYKIGGAAALLQLAAVLVIFAVTAALGTRPTMAQEYFRVYQENHLAGMLANAFDLAQHVLHPFAPSISASLTLVMGPFYLVWFPLLARDLFRLGRGSSNR